MTAPRVITLWEPWASGIALGLKRHETRSWPTPYRGWLLVHAAKRWKPDQEGSWACRRLRQAFPDWTPALGGVVAVCRLRDCGPTTAVRPRDDLDLRFGDWGPDRFAWELVDVHKLPAPVLALGKQGLTVAPSELVDDCREQLRDEVSF